MVPSNEISRLMVSSTGHHIRKPGQMIPSHAQPSKRDRRGLERAIWGEIITCSAAPASSLKPSKKTSQDCFGMW
ncbi:hypothetical protein PV08_01777 [Exophiala spinifera]|uniref:Uncharacterized protein n=1 Tax=Exophiala spinifera TaxID=91928 RepID=A0A0D2A8T8_9EURO|nr:uncharacterized protein PV08_01777 [Exophiala spinifera]KIW21197.1 hypothetical protein PV08_01777 [Exophiala spinifera]